MSDDDELTEAQLEELHQDMLALGQELEELLSANKEQSKPVELDQAAIGRLSRMDAIQQQQMAGAQRRRNELRHKQLAAALERFEEDDYGLCARCELPIGYKRLKARPESPMCITCLNEIGR